MTLVLKDGTELAIDNYNATSFLMSCGTFQEAVLAYNTITDGDNLSSVSVENDGMTVLAAEDLVSDGIQITPTATGFRAILYYHGAHAVSADAEYAMIGRILMGEEIKDEQ